MKAGRLENKKGGKRTPTAGRNRQTKKSFYKKNHRGRGRIRRRLTNRNYTAPYKGG